MKKCLLTTLFILASVILFTGCASPVEKLKNLADEVELNYESYTDEDWEIVTKKCEELETEFKESKYTKEELKEFGRQKGRISGYMTKYSIKGWGKDIEEFADELGGSIEGFFNAMGSMIEE